MLVGDSDSELLTATRLQLNSKFIDNLSVVHIRSEADISASGSSHKEMIRGAQPAIYVCKGFTCDRPIRSIEELEKKLNDL